MNDAKFNKILIFINALVPLALLGFDAWGFLHLVTYSIFDKSLSIPAIVADVWQRPFIAVGMLAFFLLIPLSVTSTNGMIKRIGGKNWARLHKLTYIIAI